MWPLRRRIENPTDELARIQAEVEDECRRRWRTFPLGAVTLDLVAGTHPDVPVQATLAYVLGELVVTEHEHSVFANGAHFGSYRDLPHLLAMMQTKRGPQRIEAATPAESGSWLDIVSIGIESGSVGDSDMTTVRVVVVEQDSYEAPRRIRALLDVPPEAGSWTIDRSGRVAASGRPVS